MPNTFGVMPRQNVREKGSHFLGLLSAAVCSFQPDSWCQVVRNNVIIGEQCLGLVLHNARPGKSDFQNESPEPYAVLHLCAIAAIVFRKL